jgi:Fe-S-cluster containining protein
LNNTGRNEKCFCGSGKKYKKCCGNKYSIHKDSLIGRLIRGYREVYNLSEPIKSKLPCKENCSECCNKTLFSIGFLEFDYIKYGLQELKPSQLEDLKRRVLALREDLLNRAPEIFEDPSRYGKPENVGQWKIVSSIHDKIFMKVGNSTCPLLENGRCIIYEYRPFVCRCYGYFNFSSTEGCNSIKENHVKYQIELPEHLIIMKVLGLWYVGKPIITYLCEQLDQYDDLTYTQV